MRKKISDAHAAIAALDLTAYFAAAVKARKLRKKDSGRAEKEYRQFLLIAWNNFAEKSREPVLPTPQADQIWHGEAPLSPSVEEYTDYAAWDALTGEQLGPDDYPMAKVLRTGEPSAPRELRIRRFDGSEGTVLVSAVPLRDAHGQGREADGHK